MQIVLDYLVVRLQQPDSESSAAQPRSRAAPPRRRGEPGGGGDRPRQRGAMGEKKGKDGEVCRCPRGLLCSDFAIENSKLWRHSVVTIL